MITPNLIWIFTISAIGIMAVTIAVLLFVNSAFRNKEFSPLRNFPFEFLKDSEKSVPVFKPLLYILTALSFAPLFVITPLISEFGDLGFLTILITCVFGLTAICNCLLFFFDARYTKTHMILVTVAMSLALLANALATLLSVLVYKNYMETATQHPISLVCAVVSGLLAISMLALAINPKLKNWAKLEEHDNPDGEKSYSRGKVFILALTEWLTLCLSVLGEIIFLISLLK